MRVIRLHHAFLKNFEQDMNGAAIENFSDQQRCSLHGKEGPVHCSASGEKMVSKVQSCENKGAIHYIVSDI